MYIYSLIQIRTLRELMKFRLTAHFPSDNYKHIGHNNSLLIRIPSLSYKHHFKGCQPWSYVTIGHI